MSRERSEMLPANILRDVCIIGSTAAWIRGAETPPVDLDLLSSSGALTALEGRFANRLIHLDERGFRLRLDDRAIDFYTSLSDGTAGRDIYTKGEVVIIQGTSIRVATRDELLAQLKAALRSKDRQHLTSWTSLGAIQEDRVVSVIDKYFDGIIQDEEEEPE